MYEPDLHVDSLKVWARNFPCKDGSAIHMNIAAWSEALIAALQHEVGSPSHN